MKFIGLDFKHHEVDDLISTSKIEPFDAELEIRIITRTEDKQPSQLQIAALEETIRALSPEYRTKMDDAADAYRTQIALESPGINRGNIRQHYQVLGITVPILEVDWKPYTFIIAHPDWYDDSLMHFTIRQGSILVCEEMSSQWDCLDWYADYEAEFPA